MTLIQPIFNENGKETGLIYSAINTHIKNKEHKDALEAEFEHDVRTRFYPVQGLNIYSDINSDTASITVIKNINKLNSK